MAQTGESEEPTPDPMTRVNRPTWHHHQSSAHAAKKATQSLATRNSSQFSNRRLKDLAADYRQSRQTELSSQSSRSRDEWFELSAFSVVIHEKLSTGLGKLRDVYKIRAQTGGNTAVADVAWLVSVLIGYPLLSFVWGVLVISLMVVVSSILQACGSTDATVGFFLCSAAALIVLANQLAENMHTGDFEAHKMENLKEGEVRRIVDGIPEEDYVLPTDIERCSIDRLRRMAVCRHICSKSKVQQLPREQLVSELSQARRVEHSCCVCLGAFERGDKIKVIPSCHHEIHSECFGDWANTFAARGKWGAPTCPLCNVEVKNDISVNQE